MKWGSSVRLSICLTIHIFFDISHLPYATLHTHTHTHTERDRQTETDRDRRTDGQSRGVELCREDGNWEISKEIWMVKQTDRWTDGPHFM